MKLIDEIIELLSSADSNLATALLKTKVLLHKLGEKDLLGWVDGELKGYPNTEKLPEYRILHVTVRGNCSNGAYTHNSQTLPLMHLEQKIREKLDTTFLTQGIAVIEEYSRNDDLHISIAPEFYPSLSKGLGNGYQVERAWGENSAGAMTQVLTEVTSRLLDFVLDLSDKFPEELEISEMKERSKELGVSDLFNNAVFGDNITILVGDSGRQEVNNSVVKNDFESLKSALLDSGLTQEDVDSLEVALESDKGSDVSNEAFGSNVSVWIGSMVSKAATTAWDVKVGAAGSLLATAIGKFYGF